MDFVNTVPAYALMLMFWCSHLLLNFAYACTYALVKTSLNAIESREEHIKNLSNTQLIDEQINLQSRGLNSFQCP